jgi:histone H2B
MAGGRGRPKKETKQQKILEPEPEEESEQEQENESEMIESNIDLSIGETEDIEQDPEDMDDEESEEESEQEQPEPPKTEKIKPEKKTAGRKKKKVQKVVDESSSSKKKGKNDKKSNFIVFSRYIHQVLNQVHPERTISSKAMNIMNNFVCDMFERLANESSSLTKLGKTLTMSSREVQTSVRLLLPGELANHAMSEGTKAVRLYSISKASDKN